MAIQKEKIQMSNKVMVSWAFIIFGLVISIYLLGITELKQKNNNEIINTIKTKVNNYLDDNDSWPLEDKPVTIEFNKLVENNYLDSLVFDNKKCDGKVRVIRGKKKFNYDFKINCEYINEVGNDQ